MQDRADRIPIPPRQRWEFVREKIFPAICLVATLATCGLLWRYQGRVVPFATGEVHVDWVEIKSPCDGELLPLEGQSDGQWPLFASIDRGDVSAKIKSGESEGDVVAVPSPLDGLITAIPTHTGQLVTKGEPILRIASPRPRYILCRLPDYLRHPPQPGLEVYVRPTGPGGRWVATTIDGVGPAVESAAPTAGVEVGPPERGLPIRIALPKELRLKPGARVDIRFAEAAKTL